MRRLTNAAIVTLLLTTAVQAQNIFTTQFTPFKFSNRNLNMAGVATSNEMAWQPEFKLIDPDGYNISIGMSQGTTDIEKGKLGQVDAISLGINKTFNINTKSLEGEVGFSYIKFPKGSRSKEGERYVLTGKIEGTKYFLGKSPTKLSLKTVASIKDGPGIIFNAKLEQVIKNGVLEFTPYIEADMGNACNVSGLIRVASGFKMIYEIQKTSKYQEGIYVIADVSLPIETQKEVEGARISIGMQYNKQIERF
jgi:hypothetical protein